uniref:Zinc finger protein 473 n=1 Tax=Nothobranchius rachovii TaxID=451742 RepID=A0A1A8QFA7_9TELE
MDSSQNSNNDPPLLLPSLRLFIPPLRLVSASMWHIVQMGSVQDYGMVEEFISTVTEIVPELLNADQKAQLLLGLRARVVLEMCRSEQISDTEAIEMHLDQIKTLVSTWAAQPCFTDVQFPESNFVHQVELFLKDPEEREKFFQDVFPTDFGPDYDHALQMLMLDFLSRLEKLLPVPDIQQTASMLSADPAALEECVRSVPNTLHLKAVLTYHTGLGHFHVSNEAQTILSSVGNCILSSLSFPRVEKVVIHPDQIQPPSEQMQNDMSVKIEDGSVALLDYIQTEQPASHVELGDHEKAEPNAQEAAEETAREDLGDALQPAAPQPPQQSRRLHLRRKASKVKNDSVKKKRKRYPKTKTCPVCSKTFLRAAAMRRHQDIHNGKQDFKSKCSDCGKRFRDQYDLNRHMMRVHVKGENPNGDEVQQTRDPTTSESSEGKTCPLCGKYFARPEDMERHMKSHSDHRPHECSFCEKKFKNPYVLKRHEKEICKRRDQKRTGTPETSETPKLPSERLEVEICNSQEHLENLSNEDKPSAPSLFLEDPDKGRYCPMCSRFLHSTRDLKKHLRSHSEERPFVCVTCEKGFKYKDTIKKHQVIKGHDGIRVERCERLEQILAEVSTQNFAASELKENNSEAPANTWDDSPFAPVPTITNKNLKVCPVCSKSFDRFKTLNKHIQSHTEDRPYHCIHCERRFKHIDNLKRHQLYAVCRNKTSRFMRTNRASKSGVSGGDPQRPLPKMPVWCSNCGKNFDCLSALEEHQETVCRPETCGAKKCPDCGKEFKTMTTLKVHQRIHNPLFCKECKKVLSNKPAFERHKLLHRPMQCTMCEETFIILRRLREHYEKQHNFVGPFPCDQCDKSFTLLSYLVIHQRIHKEEFPFVCNKCPEKFRSSNCLTVHQRKHTGEKPFLCWQCGKCYRAASELRLHMGTHSEERPWACTQCDMAYRTKQQLRNHVEQVHIGVRFPCHTCGKNFMKEMSLKRHELLHTGERPYPCKDCSKTFLTGNELLRHSRYHTGERPYKCDVCSKAFIQSSYLKIHMRLHTGEKPYKCDICDKGFRLSYHMKKHRRTHTGKPTSYVCEECGSAFIQKKALWEHSLSHDVKVQSAFAEEVGIEFQ